MANDIGFDIIKKTDTEKPFRVFSLVDNNSVVTAISNDVGYENIFINQLRIHYRRDDVLIVISASGNSENVIKAVKWVKKRGGKIVGFLGFTGGKLLNLCDVKSVSTNPGETAFTKILNGAKSKATDLVKPINPHFVDEYVAFS